MWMSNARHLAVAGLFVALVGGLAAGCPSSTLVVVDLQTDFVAGLDFDAIELEFDADPIRRTTVSAGESYARPRPIFEQSGLAPGRHRVRVTLVLGTRRYTRTRVLDVQGQHLALVVISRSCIDVVCPTAGDPSATECAAGVCVDPECDASAGEACFPVQCDEGRACGPSATACAEPVCAEGICLFVPREGGCEAGEACVAGEGCVALAVQPDAGAPRDADAPTSPDAFVPSCSGDDDCVAGPCEAARCEAGRCELRALCADSETCCGGVCASDCALVPCAGACSDTCVPGASCSIPGNPCALGRLDCSSGSPSCVVAGPAPAGTACRAAAGECDLPATCTGSSAPCPSGFDCICVASSP